MKKVLPLLMMIVTCVTVSHAGVIIGNYEYSISGDTAYLKPTTEYKNSCPTSVDIPGFVTINGQIYQVGIETDAFHGMSTVESVWMRYGVRSISLSSFGQMSHLSKVHIPSSVNYIGSYAFRNSGSNATSSTLTINWATLTPGYVEIESTAFQDCSATYRKVNMPTYPAVTAAKNIGSKLTSYFSVNSTPYPSQAADYWLSNGCYIVTSPTTSTSNGELTLVGVENNPTSLSITSSTGYTDSSFGKYYYVTSVAPQACAGNTSLSSLSITKSNFTIGEAAFRWCTNLTSANLSAAIINNESFLGCTNLSSITLNEGVQRVYSRAFEQTAITSLNLPASLLSIGVTAVDKCYQLQKFTVASGNTKYATYNNYGALFSKDLKILYKVPAKGNCPNEGYWPSQLTTIYDYAFSDQRNIYTVYIPHGVTTIGGSAFMNATSIKGIKIPSTVTSIDYTYAFYGCSNLKRLLVATQKNMKNANTYTFQGVPLSMKVYVLSYFLPEDAPYCYSAWNQFTITYGAWDVVFNGIPYVLTGDQGMLVYGVDLLEGNPDFNPLINGAITIPETVTYRGSNYYVFVRDYAFKDNTSITSVDIKGQLLGKGIFQNCTGLTSITFNGEWSTRDPVIGENCFRNTRIQYADLPYGVYIIGAQAFADNPNLKRINVPSSCGPGDLSGNFVRNCPALTQININMTSCSLMFNYNAHGEIPDVDPASSSGGCFYNVPRNCKIYVPVGARNEYLGRKTSNGYYPWRYFNSIENGASDIAEFTVIRRDDDYSFDVKYVYKPNNTTEAAYLGENTYITNRGRRFYIKELGDSCFAGCTTLKTVNVDWSNKVVTKIPDYAFDGCTALHSFTWPTATNKLATIGRNAFRYTAISGKVNLANAKSLTRIGISAFYQCNQVTDYVLPDKLNYIGNLAMYEGNTASCKLATVTCYNTTPPQLGSMVWNGVFQNWQTLYVPQASVNAYKAADQWKDFGHILAIADGDVNGDGQVTAADITALYDYMLNNDSSHIVNGDQTGDGLITAADITAVYTIMLSSKE